MKQNSSNKLTDNKIINSMKTNKITLIQNKVPNNEVKLKKKNIV
jgi:hypothetical protein